MISCMARASLTDQTEPDKFLIAIIRKMSSSILSYCSRKPDYYSLTFINFVINTNSFRFFYSF